MKFRSGTASPATFTLTYTDLQSARTTTRTVTVSGRATKKFENVLEELFQVPPGERSQGPVFIEADPNGVVTCKVFSRLSEGTLGDGFPVVPIPSEALTGSGSQKPLYIDGLEQSTDPTRGTRSNLILNEVAGQAVTVDVRLYEAGNRSQPIGQATFDLQPLQKVQLSTVFAGLGLD